MSRTNQQNLVIAVLGTNLAILWGSHFVTCSVQGARSSFSFFSMGELLTGTGTATGTAVVVAESVASRIVAA